MPKNNKNNSTPISLFSFQDIITSVTGIMILVVLLLILSILDKKLTDTPVKQESDEDKRIRIQCSKKIEQQGREIKNKQETLRQLKQIIENRQANSKSISELLKIQERLKKQQQQNTNKIKLQNKVLARKEKTRETLSKKNIALSEAEKVEIETDNLSKKELSEKIASYEKEIKKLESATDQVIFSIPKNSKKNPIIVQCSDKGFYINMIRENKNLHITDDSIDFTGLLLKFQKWLHTRNSRKDYIVLLIKPSSVGYISDLEYQILKTLSFEYSKEPLEENQIGVK